MRLRRFTPRTFLIAACLIAAAAVVGASSSPVSADTSGALALYVSPSGSSVNAGTGCGSATFTSISAAVAAAPAGGKVVACPGVYHEDVLVQKHAQAVRLWRHDRRYGS